MQHVTDEEEVRERKYQNKLAIFFFSLLVILLGLLAFTQESQAQEYLSIGNLTENATSHIYSYATSQYVVQEFTPTKENFTRIIFKRDDLGSLFSEGVAMALCKGDFIEEDIVGGYCLTSSASGEKIYQYNQITWDDEIGTIEPESGTSIGGDATTLFEPNEKYFLVYHTRMTSGTDIKYQNTDVYSGGKMYYINDTVSAEITGDTYFGIYTDYTGDLHIDAPTNNQIYTLTDINATTKNIVVSGTCPHDGEDQLLITNSLYCRYSYAEDYNIDCVDGEFTATTTMQFLGNGYPYQIMVMDRAFSLAGQILTGACVVGTDEYGQPEDWSGRQHVDINLFQDLEYNLQITSPTSTSEFIFVVQPSENFPFNFTYNIQENYIGDEFVLMEMADDNYSSSTRVIMGGQLSDLDRMRTGNLWSQENLLDYTEPGIIAENNVVKYYSVLIANASSTPTTLSRINFSVEGDTESLIFDTNQSGVGTWCSNPEAWDDNIFTEALKKSFCWLFVGNAKNKALDLKNTSELLFANKIPFAYWSKFQEEWNNPRTTGNKKIIFNLDQFDAFDNESPLNNFQIEIFDFENPGWTEAHWKVFNFLEDIVIPIWASVWVFMMAFNFFYRLSK